MCLPARLVAIVMLFLCSVLPAALASEIDSDLGSKPASGNDSSTTAPVFATAFYPKAALPPSRPNIWNSWKGMTIPCRSTSCVLPNGRHACRQTSRW